MPEYPPTPISAPTISRRTLAAGAAWAVPAATVVAAAPAYAASPCVVTFSGISVCKSGNTYTLIFSVAETCPGAITISQPVLVLTSSNGTTTEVPIGTAITGFNSTTPQQYTFTTSSTVSPTATGVKVRFGYTAGGITTTQPDKALTASGNCWTG